MLSILIFLNVILLTMLYKLVLAFESVEVTLLWCGKMMLYKVVLTFKSVDETLACDHLNKSY